MRLYYRPGTGRPLRVAWALEELRLDYAPLPTSARQSAGEEHLKRHPLGRVPALELAPELALPVAPTTLRHAATDAMLRIASHDCTSPPPVNRMEAMNNVCASVRAPTGPA